MMGEPAIWVALGSLIVNFVAIVLTTQHYAIKNAEARKEELLHLERSMRDTMDTSNQRFGETIQAIREKVVQTELWNRDNFIDKFVYNAAISDIKETGRRLEEKIDRNFKDLDRKLEKIVSDKSLN